MNVRDNVQHVKLTVYPHGHAPNVTHPRPADGLFNHFSNDRNKPFLATDF